MRGAVWAISATLLLTACMARPWTKHDYPEQAFSVSFPGEVVERTEAADGALPAGFSVTGSGEDKDLSVSVTALPAGALEDTAMNAAVAALRTDKDAMVTYWATGAQGQHMGREVVIKEGAGLSTTVHVVAFHGRLYQVSARGMGQSPNTDRFLDSFQIIETP